MSRPVVLPPGVFVPIDVCAELAPALVAILTRARSDRAAIMADTVQTVELIVRVGQSWERRGEVPVPMVPTAVPIVDTAGSDPEHCISVKEAADVLGISERAVTKRIAAGTIKAAMSKGVWVIDADSVRREAG